MTETPNPHTSAISGAGVSLWLDDLSRERLTGGSLQQLIETHNIVGVTTNPSIFANALAQGSAYDTQIRELATRAVATEEAVWEVTGEDVRQACDIFAPIFQQTAGRDGWVSLEVDPRLARDTEATVAQAQELAELVGRENLMIKIPATAEGLPAISEVLAAGISVNVTLIFSLSRYREVINAWLVGLEKALAHGLDLSSIHSVASFFVSRVDTEVDQRLESSDLDKAQIARLRGRAGLANARLAYRIFEHAQDTERWRLLQARGAHLQRPLWASTGTKNPEYSDVMYVTGLIAPHSVNTLPEATLEAVADHGELTEPSLEENYELDDQLLDDLARVGIDYHDVVLKLEDEGLQKFVDAWEQLLDRLTEQLQASQSAR